MVAPVLCNSVVHILAWIGSGHLDQQGTCFDQEPEKGNLARVTSRSRAAVSEASELVLCARVMARANR